MIIFFHVVSALLSIIYTTYLFIFPSRKKFIAAYSLVGTTLASGTYLIFSLRTNILQTCISGLVYIGLVSAGLLAAQYRLVTAEAKNKID